MVHIRGRGPHNLSTRLEALGPVKNITTSGKKVEEIKSELTSQFGKTDLVLLNNYNDFLYPEFLQYASENIIGSLVVINKRK